MLLCEPACSSHNSRKVSFVTENKGPLVRDQGSTALIGVRIPWATVPGNSTENSRSSRNSALSSYISVSIFFHNSGFFRGDLLYLSSLGHCTTIPQFIASANGDPAKVTCGGDLDWPSGRNGYVCTLGTMGHDTHFVF